MTRKAQEVAVKYLSNEVGRRGGVGRKGRSEAQGVAVKCLSEEVEEGGGGWEVREEARSRVWGGKQGGEHYAQGGKKAPGMRCKPSAA